MKDKENIKLKVMPQDLEEAKAKNQGKALPFRNFEFNISQPKQGKEMKQRRLEKAPVVPQIGPEKREKGGKKIKRGNNYGTLWLILGLLILIFFVLGGAFYYFRFYRKTTGETPVLENPPIAGLEDSDKDGLTDQKEDKLGTEVYNPDTDGDGMLDGWEIKYGLNPLSAKDKNLDLDKDKLVNGDEFRYKTDPSNADTDRDSYLDGIEVENNYDPLSGPGVRLKGFEEKKTEQTKAVEAGEDKDAENKGPQSRDERRKNDLKIIQLALEIYLEDHPETGYPDRLELLEPEYLSELPQDPLYPQYEYKYQKEGAQEYSLKIYSEEDKDYYTKRMSAERQ